MLNKIKDNIRSFAESATSPTGFILMGEVSDNTKLKKYYSFIYEQIQINSYFKLYGDTVITDHTDWEDLEDLEEFELIEARAQEEADIAVYFDTGDIDLMDLGIKLAPFIFNGCKCYVITGRPVEVSHPLINTVLI